jgi:hypothetical protein
LADRALAAIRRGELTVEEFRNSPDLALILKAAQLLRSAGADFPPNVQRLAATAQSP